MCGIVTIIFICVPFISIPLLILGIIFDKKYNWTYGILLALLLAIIAYNFNPTQEHDLYRYYFEMQNYYTNINFEQFINSNMFSNTKFLFVLLQFIIAKLGNYRILPFIITFFGYAITFYVILDYSKVKDINTKTTVIMLLIFICIFYHINFISGLAQYLAIIIGFLAFYLEFIKVKKKWFYKLLYILPMFIHLSMIIIPAIRIFIQFDFKKTKKILFVVLAIYVLLPNVLYEVIKLVPMMSMVAQKINSYMLNTDSIFIMKYEVATLFLLIFYLYIYYSGRNKIKEEVPEKYINFTEMILLFNICSAPYRAIFTRILNISILAMTIFLMIYFEKVKSKNALIIFIGLVLFSVALGSVNLNNIIANDYNGIFQNFAHSIIYYLK